MKVGIDFWNACSAYPDYFRWLALAALSDGYEVHVISAIGRSREGTVAGDVGRLGIPVTAVHEVVFSHPRESPELKTALALKLGLDVFYDDRDDVCQAMTAAGILAMRVTRPGRGSDRAAEERLSPAVDGDVDAVRHGQVRPGAAGQAGHGMAGRGQAGRGRLDEAR